MPAQPTIAQTITIGRGTIPYMGNYEAEGALFGKRLVTKDTTILVAIVTDALSWQYEDDPTDPTLRGVANYLIWLCGMFGMDVLANQGGGTVVPVNPGGTPPQRITFYVNDTNSPILDGGNTFTLPSEWAGWDILVFKTGVEQTELTDGSDSSYTWNPITRIFTCTPNAATGDKFSILPNLG